MKKNNIIAEGNCGLTIELTIIDQYRLSDELTVVDTHDAECNAEAAWEQNKEEYAKSGEGWEEKNKLRRAFEEANPRPKPTITPDRLNQAHENILKFVRKFALDGDRTSNIFAEE